MNLFSYDVYDFITVDLIGAEVELKEVCDALRRQGVKHWLSSGTLLGIYRDGRFLKGDTDIDIGIMADKVPIIEGYEIRTIKIIGEVMQVIYKSPRNVAVDLTWFYEDGDNIISKNIVNRDVQGTWVKPKKMFENLVEIEFKGNRYPCPSPEQYFPMRFKNWRTPMPREGKDWWFFTGEMWCT